MFMAAAPYFASRFAGDAWIVANFQSAILVVSTAANLVVMLALSQKQHSASYPLRINAALVINVTVFALLTASTCVLVDAATPRGYLVFLLAMVAASATAAGLIQNGAFAFAASFSRPEYTQAIMVGQGVSGVLPPVAQVITVLAFPPASSPAPEDGAGSKRSILTSRTTNADTQSSAFLYFLTAVVISALTFVAFIPLVRRHNRLVENRMIDHMARSVTSVEEAERAARKSVPLLRLFLKLRWLALGIALTFTETMFFPVFTSKILSNNDGPDAGTLFRPAAFIPLAFFFWNLGDLGGRMATILPFSLNHRPRVLFSLAAARAALIPLYLLCNIGGRGAVVPSDFFYLFVVQLAYGVTNGWIGSSCMMAAGEWVDEGEREAAGGFMGLCLVAGLSLGSFLSFSIANI
jgi:solute carrier family 29 (equilibrative nucleoside transporter), member 1/2/3